MCGLRFVYNCRIRRNGHTHHTARVDCAGIADHHTARIKHLCRLIRVREAGQTHRIAIQYKTEKEYLCVKDGEERGFTASEFKAAQVEGWEKQYPYKVGKKKVYTAPSVNRTPIVGLK